MDGCLFRLLWIKLLGLLHRLEERGVVALDFGKGGVVIAAVAFQLDISPASPPLPCAGRRWRFPFRLARAFEQRNGLDDGPGLGQRVRLVGKMDLVAEPALPIGTLQAVMRPALMAPSRKPLMRAARSLAKCVRAASRSPVTRASSLAHVDFSAARVSAVLACAPSWLSAARILVSSASLAKWMPWAARN